MGRDDLAYIDVKLAQLLNKTGKFTEARKRLSEAVPLRLQLVRQSPDNVVYGVRLAGVYETLGDVAWHSSDWNGALAQYTASRQVLVPLPGKIAVGII